MQCSYKESIAMSAHSFSSEAVCASADTSKARFAAPNPAYSRVPAVTPLHYLRRIGAAAGVGNQIPTSARQVIVAVSIDLQDRIPLSG